MNGGFERLHPSVQHHIVNTLGWARLRPLQQDAVAPILAGEHGLLLAPTAGGKTEAAVFPVLSKMAAEDWRPLSVLYLAPLRALLNNLLPRLEQYGSFVGRRVGLWHGDTSQSQRARIISDPPDLLLTTPESLEAMLISQRNNLYTAFGNTVDRDHLRAALQQPTSEAELARLVTDVSGPLKLQRALPEKLVDEILVRRLRDTTAVSSVVEAPIDQSTPDLGD